MTPGSDIIACDLNAAPSGIAIDEQLDQRRELPAATGVIAFDSQWPVVLTMTEPQDPTTRRSPRWRGG